MLIFVAVHYLSRRQTSVASARTGRSAGSGYHARRRLQQASIECSWARRALLIYINITTLVAGIEGREIMTSDGSLRASFRRFCCRLLAFRCSFILAFPRLSHASHFDMPRLVAMRMGASLEFHYHFHARLSAYLSALAREASAPDDDVERVRGDILRALSLNSSRIRQHACRAAI